MTSPSPLDAADLPDAVWRADALAAAPPAVQPSGHAALDAQLPGGGWPVGALVEILQAHSAQNEWRLLLPALARTRPGPVVLVGAPHPPFAPALAAQGLAAERLLCIGAATPASRLWACEQALRCAEVVAVLGWLPQVRVEQLRRLQIAAAEHAKLLFVMRPARAQAESSPAVLRVQASVQPDSDLLQVDVLKRRGPPCAQPLRLPARMGRLSALLARPARAVRPMPGPAPVPAGTTPPPVPLIPGIPSHALDRVAGGT